MSLNILSKKSKNQCVKGDFTWCLLITIWILILIIPMARTVYIRLVESHPYIGGFIKFFILASMGDMLGSRIVNGTWSFPRGFVLKAVVWGILGVLITLVFSVFSIGAAGAMENGKLPFEGNQLALAFFSSTIMNVTFGPMLYIYHRFGDLLVDMLYEKRTGTLQGKITINAIVKRIDWYGMVRFSWLTCCLLVWIPCHTMVFLLPQDYRVLASAFLSILLGLLVAVSKKNSLRSVYTLNEAGEAG